MIDDLDSKLLALLRVDSRAPLSLLAHKLGVSRGTVQNRIQKMLREGAIARFTVELPEPVGSEAIRAIMLIEVQGKPVTPVSRSLLGVSEVRKVHSTNGAWDLVVELNAADLPALDRALRAIRSIQGISNSETSILLSTSAGRSR